MTANWLNGGILLALVFSFSAKAGIGLEHCLAQVPPPVISKKLDDRRRSILLALQDHLSSNPQLDIDSSQCLIWVKQQLHPTTPLPDPKLLADNTSYLALVNRPRKIRLAPHCQTSAQLDSDILSLSRSEVGRYLYRGQQTQCRQSVWLAWQNRGGNDASDAALLVLKQNQNHAQSNGFASAADKELQGAYLNSPAKVSQFLGRLDPLERRLPWGDHHHGDYFDVAPMTLAKQSLTLLSDWFGLSVKPVDKHTWQIWDDKRFLGYVHLYTEPRHRLTVATHNRVGYYFGDITIGVRERVNWRHRHVQELFGNLSQGLWTLAGHGVKETEIEPDLIGLPKSIGQMLAFEASWMRSLKLIPPPPYQVSAYKVFQAELALAMWSTPFANEAQLLELQSQLFADNLNVDAPSPWFSWRGDSRWLTSGVLSYRSLLQQQLAKQLIERHKRSGQRIWQRLYVDGHSHKLSRQLAELGVEPDSLIH